MSIEVYSSDYCPFCVRAKSLLKSKSLAYKEYKVDGNPKLRAAMQQKSGRTSVPQIWVAGVHIGGCDELFLLERTGKLDKLLAAEA